MVILLHHFCCMITCCWWCFGMYSVWKTCHPDFSSLMRSVLWPRKGFIRSSESLICLSLHLSLPQANLYFAFFYQEICFISFRPWVMSGRDTISEEGQLQCALKRVLKPKYSRQFSNKWFMRNSSALKSQFNIMLLLSTGLLRLIYKTQQTTCMFIPRFGLKSANACLL